MIEVIILSAAQLALVSVVLFVVRRSDRAVLELDRKISSIPRVSSPKAPLSPAFSLTEPDLERHDVTEIRHDGTAIHRYTGSDHGAADAVFQQLKQHSPDSTHLWHKGGHLHKHRTAK